KGYNWPDPHPDVIATFKRLRENGVIVSLCTGKGTFAIKNIVEKAHLDNVHIGDGGAIVIDYIHNSVITQHVINKEKVIEIVKLLLANNVYVELYTKDGYYVQEDCVGNKTIKHSAILYREPFLVKDLLETARDIYVVKIMPVADNEEDKKRVINLFQPYAVDLTLQWGVHLTALPYQFGIITMSGISKVQAARVISEHTNISLNEMLGVGDGMTDWQFMEICGYAGAMGNASQELKDKVIAKGQNGYIGKSVDENGLLDILTHFKVI
ncbi:MAG: HAD-IIB family hydrolase, partial [Patescibacteria group bacterium]